MRVAKGAGANGIEDGGKVLVQGEAAEAVVLPQLFDVLGQGAKEEDVFFLDLAGDFNLSPVRE